MRFGQGAADDQESEVGPGNGGRTDETTCAKSVSWDYAKAELPLGTKVDESSPEKGIQSGIRVSVQSTEGKVLLRTIRRSSLHVIQLSAF